MGKSIIDELVTLLGVEISPRTQRIVNTFNSGLDKIGKFAVTAAASISSAAVATTYFAEKATASASALDKFVELTGESAASIQKWAYAAEQAGGSADSVKSDIMGLVKALNPVMPGEFNQGLFMLGMYEKKYEDAGDMMLALSDKLNSMPAGKALNWANQIGISEETLLLLKKGRSGITDLMKSTPYLLSDKQLDHARKFEAQMDKVKFTMKQIGMSVGVGITKPIGDIVERVGQWVEKNRELIATKVDAFITGFISGLGKILDVGGAMLNWLRQAVPGIGEFVDGLTSAESIGRIVTFVFAAFLVVMAALNIQWVLIAAVIVAAAVALNDFIKYIEGGESVIGKWLNNFNTNLSGIAGTAKLLWDVLKAITKITLGVVLDDLKRVWRLLVDITEVINYLLYNGLKNFAPQYLEEKKPEVSNNPVDNPLVDGPTYGTALMARLNNVLDRFSGGMPVANNNTNNSSTTVQNSNSFYIQSTDPYGVAREVQSKFPSDYGVRNLAPVAQ